MNTNTTRKVIMIKRVSWRVRAIAAVTILTALAVTTYGQPPAASAQSVDTTNVSYAPQSTSSAPAATPREWMSSFYSLGITIQAPNVVLDGEVVAPTLTRILARDGNYYALVELNGGKYALSESDGAVWDTHNDPHGDNSHWTFLTLDLVAKIAEILIFLWNDPVSLLSWLLIILLALLFILIIIRLYWNVRLNNALGDRNKMGQWDQWHNEGIPLWVHGRDIPGHPTSFSEDMGFLDKNDPAFRAEVNKYPTARYWLDTGQLPQSVVFP